MKLTSKFWKDTGWNYLSLGIQAGVGIAINLLILFFMGTESLGVFNQIYAIFVVAGQVTVLGLHDSALKHSSEFSDSPHERHSLSVAALLTSTLGGLVGALLLAVSSGWIGRLVESEPVGRGVLYLAPGLFFFTLNKVLMGILNGQRRMAAFALGQAVRPIAILIFCLGTLLRRGDPAEFGLNFTLAEIVMLLGLLFVLKAIPLYSPPTGTIRGWMVRHLSFGSRALVHGFLSETFIRVDILMLGIFLSDREVGIYSFASLFLEGVYQVPIVIRTLTNPILVKLVQFKDLFALVPFSRRTASLSLVATLVTAVVVFFVYPLFGLLFPPELVEASRGILLILLGGLVAYASFIPFDYIFIEGGRPGVQSLFMAGNTLVNVLLNWILIPPYGIYGACIATAAAFCFSAVSLNLLSSRILGFEGGPLGLTFPRRLVASEKS